MIVNLCKVNCFIHLIMSEYFIDMITVEVTGSIMVRNVEFLIVIFVCFSLNLQIEIREVFTFSLIDIFYIIPGQAWNGLILG